MARDGGGALRKVYDDAVSCIEVSEWLTEDEKCVLQGMLEK